MAADMNQPSTRQTVAITGATGLVGTALSDLLQQRGDQVIAVTRGEGQGYQDSMRWDPVAGLVNPARMETVDAVVHLAGENIASGRWTDSQKQRIRNSRVQGTRCLVESLAKIAQRPKTLVCASAVGFYGDRGDRVLTEQSTAGTGFLADVCREWEAEAMQAATLGMRVVCVRTGVVLNPSGGALAKMLLPFKMGVGGRVGSGQQYWSWIGLQDLARVFAFCLDHESLSGPVNAVSPQAVTNAQFTRVLGQVLHRPTIFPLPALVVRLALGQMADELLLASIRVLPEKLTGAGFQFATSDLQHCLETELGAA